MHSDKQSVTIFTNPPEASVVIDDYLHLTAPGTVTLSRKGNHLARVNRQGFEPTSLKIDRTWSWWVPGDIFGCLVIFSPICIMNDIDQGASIPSTTRSTSHSIAARFQNHLHRNSPRADSTLFLESRFNPCPLRSWLVLTFSARMFHPVRRTARTSFALFPASKIAPR
jgi:PEGA domain-containing protein